MSLNNESKHTDPFDLLSEDEQKAAIEVAVAVTLLELRMPSAAQLLYDLVADEFATTYILSHNVTKYALQSLGRRLMAQNWTLVIEKNQDKVSTIFTPGSG